MESIVILFLFLSFMFNILYYIPNMLKKQNEKQSLYVKELYIRINRLESKIDELMNSNNNG